MSKTPKMSAKDLQKQVEILEETLKVLKGQSKSEMIYKITEEQMKDLVSSLYREFTEWNKSEISQIEFSDSAVSFEMDGNVIIPTIDSDMISEEIESSSESPTETQMMNIVSEIMEDMCIELVEDETCE